MVKKITPNKTEGCIEEKNTYYISKENNITVRDLQLVVLDIMDEIDRVCRKNNISYGLIAGSALGMVNYKGFIPWDDDIDMCVLRSDWDKFIEALKKDLSDDYYFQCFETDKKFNTINGPTMKIRKKGTYIEESNFLLKNKCKGNGVFVDVIIYDNVCENKFVDELCRTVVKVVMPFIVLLDNLHINPVHLKKFVVWFSNKYSRKYENSKLISQPISVPWEKFLHEPVFMKKDVLPFKEYDFEGRKFYSYKNIEKILKQWYGPNCLKKWDNKNQKWVETLPIIKRKPKHTVYLNLKDETPPKKIKQIFNLSAVSLLFILISIILFNQLSFVFLGSALVMIGIILLYFINR